MAQASVGQVRDDAEALLQKELEQIDARLASLRASPGTSGTRVAGQSHVRHSFSPSSRSGAAFRETPVSNKEVKATKSTKVKGAQPVATAAPAGSEAPTSARKAWVPAAPKVVSDRGPEPKQASLAEGRARWQRISKRLQGEKEKKEQSALQQSAEAKAKAKFAPRSASRPSAAGGAGGAGAGSQGKVARVRRSANRSSEAMPQAAKPIGAYVGPEHAVSVSLEAAAPDLLEVEFSKVLFAVQGTSYLPPAIELPPGDTARRKFFAVAERVVPVPDGASEVKGASLSRSLLDLSLPS